MKNYSIIEDFVSDQFDFFLAKDDSEKITDAFLRNYSLIKKYAHDQDQLFFTKFKKKVIPRFVQQLEEYAQCILNRQKHLCLTKRKFCSDNSLMFKRSRRVSPQLTSQPLLNQQLKFPADQFIQTGKKPKLQPLLGKGIQSPKNAFQTIDQTLNEEKYVQNSEKQHNQNRNEPNQRKKAIEVISPKRQLMTIQKIQAKTQKDTKIQASIYNDSINFTKKLFFQTSFDQMCRTRKQRELQQNQPDYFNIRSSYTDQKTLQKKMIDVLRKRRSTKTMKMKIFSNYIKSKKELKDDSQKEKKIEKKSLSKKQFPTHKKTATNLSLKGKICLQMKHRVSASCTFEKPNQSTQIARLTEKTHKLLFSPQDQNIKKLSQKISILKDHYAPSALCMKEINIYSQKNTFYSKFL